jgi:hypothetical protein
MARDNSRLAQALRNGTFRNGRRTDEAKRCSGGQTFRAEQIYQSGQCRIEHNGVAETLDPDQSYQPRRKLCSFVQLLHGRELDRLEAITPAISSLIPT